ncbi:hypothetical protein DR64_7263 [Paraburkholderia xenovorans LB400]|uniref:Uncharacterized protein n=2 Tax=Paraburkholderia xenovorans TaxID=36873 RepID=Q13PH0_PARXL|nr:Conserved hypothetical protein [Paraburkholderia xenovorans LB400]AIP37820.1 hypothetical protein DR64_7263 [Paraburkholderia xenovorans LB400]
MPMDLPPFLRDAATELAGAEAVERMVSYIRPAEQIMTAPVMGSMKASRVSFAYVLARRMIEERWRITLVSCECDANGQGRLEYRINANGTEFTYIARAYEWDGKEKVGRRSDGANRDMFGALFLGVPGAERIEQEFATFDLKNVETMRTDSAVLGWTPANRSARIFDHVVEALAAGHQPEPGLIGSASAYLLRNGGFQGSGRNGSISYPGISAGHPLRHPFFADLFGLYMVRQVSIDLVNAIAKARNPNAARLSDEIAGYLAVGNSSGQGMCVALQRWPHWVSTWLTVREAALAYARSMPVDEATTAHLKDLLKRVAAYCDTVAVPTEDYVVSNKVIAANLRDISKWLEQSPGFELWDDLARAAVRFDQETQEQLNSLLIDLYPVVADRFSDYLFAGATRERDVQPEMTIAGLRRLLREHYSWALRYDTLQSQTRQHFWYHSADNGEQRRGERIIDPHEEFESFVDHIGIVQRLCCVAASYADDALVGELMFDHPDLEVAVSRVQYLADLPYAEIRDNLIHKDFIPAQLIRFFLASLGIECSTPLSIRYVRGVFFQGAPLPAEIARGTTRDWRYPLEPELQAEVLS